MPKNAEMLKFLSVQIYLSVECDIGISDSQSLINLINIGFSKLWDETVEKLSYFETH
jgi:hypothetical protein